jgi:serine/threonine protein kinase
MTANSPTGSFDSSPLLFISKGNTLHDVDEDQLPYVWRRNLGSDGCGIVEEVEDSNTGSVYARKLFQLKSWNKGSMKELFENEVEIIKSLGVHHHLIQVFATYTTKDKLGMILYPVAEGGDLHEFLTKFRELRSSPLECQTEIADMTIVLERAFGCLAEGLAYMHERKIRHKDIKAQNILIYHGNVIYTDFGLSFDSTLFDNSTTEGIASMTRRYAAPVVIQNRPRNTSSDVFSLGCVFVEILSALNNGIPHLEQRAYSETMPNIHAQLHSTDYPRKLYCIPKIIIGMTWGSAPARPSARQVKGAIPRHHGSRCRECWTSVTMTDSEMTYIIDGPNILSLRSLDVLKQRFTWADQTLTEKFKEITTGRIYASRRIISRFGVVDTQQP